MSIFRNRTTVTESSVAVESYKGYVDDSLAGLQTILAESSIEMSQLRAGMYISDIIMEHSVMEGAQPEVLLESFAKGALGKIKAGFQKLWAKVKAWFEKAKKAIQLIFSSGEEFIKKFKEDLRKKTNTKGFTYHGYKFTLSAGESKLAGHVSTLKKELDASVGFDLSHVTTDQQVGSITNSDVSTAKHKGDSFNLSEEKEELVKKLGHDDLSEVLKDLAEAFRGGSDSKEDFEEFSGGNSKEEMIKIVEESKKSIKKIEDDQKSVDAQFQRVFAAIQKAEAKIEGTKSNDEAHGAILGKQVTFAQHKLAMAQHALTVQTSLVGVQVDAMKEAARQSESVLKAFLRFKPAKESWVNEDEETETGSILEAAMKLF